MSEYKYSILTYIVGDYEIPHEIVTKLPHVEYVMVTDNPNIKSETWNVKLVQNPCPNDPFFLCYQIRFHPFQYVSTNIVMRIDGSMIVNGNTDIIYNEFVNKNYDAALVIHPTRNNLFDEYVTWCNLRNYSTEQASKILAFCNNVYKYDYKNYKGLYQFNFIVQKNDMFNTVWNNLIFNTLLYLAEPNKTIERIDQTIGSMILNIYYNNKNILTLSEEICNNNPFIWCLHGTNSPMQTVKPENRIIPYIFNNITNTFI